jgi:ABC-2 type transport system permease protein
MIGQVSAEMMWRMLVGLYAIWLREVKRAIRDRGQLIGGVSRPLLWVLIMGIGLNPYFRGEIYGEVRFVIPYTYLQFIFPAVIALNILYTSVQSAVSLIWDREFGFLREVLVSPLPRAVILLGKVLGGTTVAMFHGCFVLVLARFVDIPFQPRDIATALGLMFLMAFGLTSLGVVIANRIRSFEGFGVFSNVVILPLYFTSSSIFPLDPALTGAQTRIVYPEWLVTLVEINPMTYAIDSLRGALIHYHQFDPRLGPIVLVAVDLLPPDTSLAELKRVGALRVCVPPVYPPLVTGDSSAPGLDIELLRAVADRLGVGLELNHNAAMGRDFNPRAWRLTRAQCQVLAGGVVDSPMTRSFLDVTQAHANTGWATITKGTGGLIAGNRIGVLVSASGLDRIALSRYLRALSVKVIVVSSPADLAAGLAQDDFDVGLTDALLAGWIAAEHGWTAAWLPGNLERYPVVFGLWKGDLTLKRSIVAALVRLENDGSLTRIVARYLGRNPLFGEPSNSA